MTARQPYAVIVAAGSLQSDDAFYEPILARSAYNVAADAGLRVFTRLGRRPDLLIGDFDSLQRSEVKAIEGQIPVLGYPSDKDKTDTQLALELVVSKGYRRICILGGIGSRLDHTLANLQLLYYGRQQGATVTLLDARHEVHLLGPGETLVLQPSVRRWISVLPLSQQLVGLTLQGFRWELQEATISLGQTIGISNYLLQERGEIHLREGLAYIICAQE